MLHGYFVSAILKFLGQEQIRRKRVKIDILTISNEQKKYRTRDLKQSWDISTEPSRKIRIPLKSGTEIDQEFSYPAVDFSQAAVD